MIDLITNMLELDDFLGMSKNIDIAKGANKIPMTIKEGMKQRKRKQAWQRT